MRKSKVQVYNDAESRVVMLAILCQPVILLVKLLLPLVATMQDKKEMDTTFHKWIRRFF